MQTIEYRNRDKSRWPRGEWDDEPDKVQWPDEATGLPCLIVRNPLGGLCGYVGVGPSHPWYGKGYDDIDVEVHGGLTFADKCSESTREVWERWRNRMVERKAEAAQFPVGDAARDWRECGHLVDDFEAWQQFSEGATICHKAEPGDFEPAWWFGFDCLHCGDAYPGGSERMSAFRSMGETYKNIAYVRGEVTRLAKQIAASESAPTLAPSREWLEKAAAKEDGHHVTAGGLASDLGMVIRMHANPETPEDQAALREVLDAAEKYIRRAGATPVEPKEPAE